MVDDEPAKLNLRSGRCLDRLAAVRQLTAAAGPAPFVRQVFSRYPVLNIHHTTARQTNRKIRVMPALIGTLMSEMP